MTPKGLMIFVYRSGLGDCTNGGVSAAADRLLMVSLADGSDWPFEAGDMPVVQLVKGNVANSAKLVPINAAGKWTMFGGNFGYTSDSRFAEAVRNVTGGWSGPVPIHDRIE